VANNYFDEEKFLEMLFEFQRTAVTKVNSEGKTITIIKNEYLEGKITEEVSKIVKAIIQVYRYYVFEPYEDCFQHGMEACFKNYLKFNPEKGTAFNYFSWIAKTSILNYTDRKKRHRNHADIEELTTHYYEDAQNFDFFLENLEDVLFRVIDENFLGKKRKKYLKIATVILEYIETTRKLVSKTDMYKSAKSWGISSSEIRSYIADMSPFIEEIYATAGN